MTDQLGQMNAVTRTLSDIGSDVPIFVPLEVIGTPMQILTALGLSVPTIMLAAAFLTDSEDLWLSEGGGGGMGNRSEWCGVDR